MLLSLSRTLSQSLAKMLKIFSMSEPSGSRESTVFGSSSSLSSVHRSRAKQRKWVFSKSFRCFLVRTISFIPSMPGIADLWGHSLRKDNCHESSSTCDTRPSWSRGFWAHRSMARANSQPSLTLSPALQHCTTLNSFSRSFFESLSW